MRIFFCISSTLNLIFSAERILPRPSRIVVKKTPSPCLVCGDETSYVAVGLRCCRSCYSFSMKALNRNISYSCVNGETCIVGKGRRSCSFCRLRKCHLLGIGVERLRMFLKIIFRLLDRFSLYV